MSWEVWIENSLKFDNCDDLLDFIVDKFGINTSGRTNHKVDLRQFMALWWFERKYRFKKYKTNELVAKRLGLDNHASVTHLTNYRVPTKDYEKNTQPLVEAIEKHYICI